MSRSRCCCLDSFRLRHCCRTPSYPSHCLTFLIYSNFSLNSADRNFKTWSLKEQVKSMYLSKSLVISLEPSSAQSLRNSKVFRTNSQTTLITLVKTNLSLHLLSNSLSLKSIQNTSHFSKQMLHQEVLSPRRTLQNPPSY